MTELELANELKKMYERALPTKEQTTMIHLFGIMYAKVIRDNGFIPRNILKYADMPESYQVEINKGIKLAKYVAVK
ncbi:HTH-like domain-containing protein [Clostridium estertheticum]|uniref:HTH-like domain-containing protein n=1 Tax=Clostridium estertheticum TaxID=238834 RepID=UPI001CF31004|nr:hypothetical protein [Clostridium estertheticum]MCB2343305.1 hypothetical protein [Clostridium estertheticum]